MHRTDVSFPSGDSFCAGWHYTPDGHTQDAPGPIIVLGHGIAGVKEQRLDAFAERFTEAGYSCLVFDYRHFGASGGEPRELLDVHRQRQDWKAAVAHARTLPGADPDRVVVWGTSFGGGHSIVTAAEDRRIVAAIAQCPFTDGLASTRTVPPMAAARLMTLGAKDALASRRGQEPLRLPAYAAPGELGLMSTPDALSGFLALNPVGITSPLDIPARFALQLPTQFPGRRAQDVHCPLHVAICEKDSVAPSGPTQRHVSRAPRGEMRFYDTGHFDIYVGEWFELNVAAQLDFLRRHVPVAG